MKKRTGAPTEGTQAAAGTDNDQAAPRIITFSRPVSPCIVTNHCTNRAIVVKINTEISRRIS